MLPVILTSQIEPQYGPSQKHTGGLSYHTLIHGPSALVQGRRPSICRPAMGEYARLLARLLQKMQRRARL